MEQPLKPQANETPPNHNNRSNNGHYSLRHREFLQKWIAESKDVVAKAFAIESN